MSIVSAGAALAQARPDFSGTWARTGGQVEEIQIWHSAAFVTIAHPEPEHGQHAPHPHLTQIYQFDRTRENQPNLASWDGDKLLLVIQKTVNGPQHRRALTLQPDGQLLMEVTITVPGKPRETFNATFKKKHP